MFRAKALLLVQGIVGLTANGQTFCGFTRRFAANGSRRARFASRRERSRPVSTGRHQLPRVCAATDRVRFGATGRQPERCGQRRGRYGSRSRCRCGYWRRRRCCRNRRGGRSGSRTPGRFGYRSQQRFGVALRAAAAVRRRLCAMHGGQRKQCAAVPCRMAIRTIRLSVRTRSILRPLVWCARGIRLFRAV
jgi:hypothetical protein